MTVNERDLIEEVDEVETDVQSGWWSLRPWPIFVISFLLLLQAIGLAGIGFWQYRTLADWQQLSLNILLNFDFDLFFLLFLFSFVSSMTFFSLRQWAWNLATFTQGLMLLVALMNYWASETFFAYFMMGYGILMVLYLNYPDVRIVFRSVGQSASEEMRT